MGPFDHLLKGTKHKPLPSKKPKVIVVPSVPTLSDCTRTTPSQSSSPVPPLVPNGKAKQHNGHERAKSRSLTPASTIKKESLDPVKRALSSNHKRSSSAASTPRFVESDEEDDVAPLRAAKRPRLGDGLGEDLDRQVKHPLSFTPEEQVPFSMIHAKDVANYGIDGLSSSKYINFFDTLGEDEEDEPVVELQYPGSSQREIYNLVRSTDREDFAPVDEIIHMVQAVARYLVDEKTALKLNDEEGHGLVQRLEQARSRGLKGKPGAQKAFLDTVAEYNSIILSLRKSGTIESYLSSIHTLPFPLVEMIFNQAYSRAISRKAYLLRDYENGTSTVYGELLPRFMSTIFAETGLNSKHVFVDMGSGVGNCALQAALQTGCEAFGCEIMKNPADLAVVQKSEFLARCRLWGLQPGQVHLWRADFLSHPPILAALKRADVVLINNRAFQADLDEALKWLFLDLKEGCQIVSLKPFRDFGYRITQRQIDAPINVLQVTKKEYPTKSVSWTGEAGDWFLSVKDSRELEEFRRKRGLN